MKQTTTPGHLAIVTNETINFFKAQLSSQGQETTPKKVYKPSELTKFGPHIELAQFLWQEAAELYYKEHGDEGACIIGDGIEVEVLPPRCKRPRRLMIIPSNKIASCQGSIHYEATKHVPMEYLKAIGLETIYNYGWMD